VKAIVQDQYGGADVLRVRDLPTPEIGDDGVLVRVKAASVNAADWHEMTGRPLFGRLQMGLRRPKQTTLGADVAGIVEAVGSGVTELSVGDEVFGARSGSFAEFVAGRVRNFVAKPQSLSFEAAAAIPVAAITALQGLRDHGRLEPGQRVLIVGAGGGVGTFAVQLAKVMGADVTAVTSAEHLEMVRGLGPDVVLEHASVGDAQRDGRFDLVLDVGGYRTVRDLRAATKPDGICVLVGAGKASLAGLALRITGARFRSRFLHQPTIFYLAKIQRDDLLHLAELAASGRIRPVVDRTYEFGHAQEAMRAAMTGRVGGKVVITF
jgi:NADPH:quinone reductase-like Zn-dependent oxidoreductase